MDVFVAFPGIRGPLQVWLEDGASSLVDDLSTKIFALVSSDRGLSPKRFERWHRATRLSTLGGRCVLRSGERLFECGIGQECRSISICVMLRVVGGIDFQNRVGSKPGSGGVMSSEQANIDRRERLRKLALETVDLNKDPYFMRNHLGTYECKLCLTLHNTEGVSKVKILPGFNKIGLSQNYLAHTQGKRHQQNLARRAFKERSDVPIAPQTQSRYVEKRHIIKIGRPGYKVTKSRDLATKQRMLLFEIDYPEAEDSVQPRHRFMSAYEQRVEPPDKRYQFLLFACDPYETIAFKIPNHDIDKSPERFFTNWDVTSKKFTVSLMFADNQQTGTAQADPGPVKHRPQLSYDSRY